MVWTLRDERGERVSTKTRLCVILLGFLPSGGKILLGY